MFHYEYEKPSQPPKLPEWTRSWRSGAASATLSEHQPSSFGGDSCRSSARALPSIPRTVICSRIHEAKPTVPLKVWIVASASCFAVCAALVVATIAVTKWGYTNNEVYHSIPVYREVQTPQAHHAESENAEQNIENDNTFTEEVEPDIELPTLEKLLLLQNVNREKIENDDLMKKPQYYPEQDLSLMHTNKKIEKKDKPKKDADAKIKSEIPEFKPTLPDVFSKADIKLPDGYVAGIRKYDDYYNEYFYNDDNLYDDYMQSNTMTSYLIEKIQELHDWITTDPDFDVVKNSTKRLGKGNEFSQLLKALNESIVDGNITIVMSKLKDIYYGDNYTRSNQSRNIILSNGTDLLSFGILSLDVMLLHNIQRMAWESQEPMRIKMLKDPDVFAFNALFMDPNKVESKREDLKNHEVANVRRGSRQNVPEDADFGKSFLENILELGLSTARAAIHLGRAYKNTKSLINQRSNQNNIQVQLSRNLDANKQALKHLETSYNKNDSNGSVASINSEFYTELDCVWLLYCKNLAATTKLNAPYGTMARINGVALRMLSGELPADKALDMLLYEAFTGWTDLKCPEMFPRCSKVNAAEVIIDSITQPIKKSKITT